MSTLKQLSLDWLPPALVPLLRKMRKGRIKFYGDYATWNDAKAASSGYDDEGILTKVRDATLKVKRGEAVFERDSVCFYHEEFRWPTLACLLSVAANRGGQLYVLDFGGSLGSFYFQHRKFFSGLKEVRWAVVEQKHFVECGRAEIQDEALKFYESVDDCLAEGPVDVIFISGVLQYLEHPYGILTALGQAKAPYLLIDRTPFIERAQDRLTVQDVPESIYKASYPAWFFSRQQFETAIAGAGYHLITEFSCDDHVGIGEFKGLLYALY